MFDIGKAKTKENRQSIINPDWNFEKMGIGGLDKEFSDIFRRAFASRVFPPEIVEQMGEFKKENLIKILYFFLMNMTKSLFSNVLKLFFSPNKYFVFDFFKKSFFKKSLKY